MSLETLRLGYVPLTDAGPLIVAQEIGFAAEEGLSFDLVQLQSWAQSRDLLGSGDIDAAHMLVPLPIAQALGLGPALPPFDLLLILSQGGQAVAVSTLLEQAMRAAGHDFGFVDPVAAGAALRTASGGTLRHAARRRAVSVFDPCRTDLALAGRRRVRRGSVGPHRAAATDGRCPGLGRGRRVLRG